MDQSLSSELPQSRPPDRTEGSSAEVTARPVIPDHELLRRVGRGSYGAVWLARSILGVYRAVKIVERKSFTDQKPFERELSGIRRFEPISRSHEGFIDVLQVGIDEARGFFYYVMELGDDQADGQNICVETYAPKTLAKLVSERRTLSWQECLELGLALSLALGELHKHGLVHRDVKPSNIIFVNGVPKLADIGLVADVGEACSYVGTEGFIPPEGPGQPQADVYGLGKVLYEVSTGRDRQDFPELPTLWDKSPDMERWVELNEIILHACNGQAQKRYHSAWEMHADLLVLANGKSIRRLKTLERRMHHAKRLSLASSLAVAAAVGLGYPVYRSHKVVSEARQQQVGANIAYGNRALETGDLLGSLPYFIAALQLDEANSAHELEHRLRLGSILAQCPKLVHLWPSPREIDQVGFSPDGQRVLTVEWRGQAQILDAATGNPLTPRFGRSAGSPHACFSPDGAWVANAAEEQTVRVWSSHDGAEVLTLEQPDSALALAFSPDGRRIAVAGRDGVTRVWSTNGVQELTLKGHTNAVLGVAYSPDGRRLATSSRDGTARLWDSVTGAPLGEPLPHPNWVRVVAFSPDARLLVTGCADRWVRIWEVDTGRRILPDLEHKDELRAVQFSPDGKLIMTASLDHTVCLWRTIDHQPMTPYPVLRHSDRVTHAAVAPDGHRIVSACIDGTVRVWDLAGTMVAAQPMHHPFSADGRRFALFQSNQVQVIDATSRSPVGTIITPTQTLGEVRLSAKGDFISNLATNRVPGDCKLETWSVVTGRALGPAIQLGFQPRTLMMDINASRVVALAEGHGGAWDLASGQPFPNLHLADAGLEGAALAPTGRLLAGWGGNTVRVWELATGREPFPALEHPFPVTHVEFSPDGARFVACGADKGFTKCYSQIYDAANGKPLGPQMPHGDGVVWATFSHDGRRLASAGEDFNAFVWDAADGKQRTPALRHENLIWSVAFSANDRWVVTSSSDWTARVWDAETGDPLTPPFRHLDSLRSARFIQDDTILVTFDRYGGAVMWPLPVEQMPIEDLLDLSKLLCGGMLTAAAPHVSSRGETPSALWRRLSAKYPGRFSTSPEDIAAWHQFMARQNELEHNEPAELFHIQRLRQLHPQDSALANRLATLTAASKPN